MAPTACPAEVFDILVTMKQTGSARRRLTTLAGLTVASVLAVAPTASAQDGLDVSSESRYTVAPGGGPVKASVTFTLRNETPDQGNTFYFWSEYGVPIPAGAKNVTALSGGQKLQVSLKSSDYPSEVEAVVTFPSRLLYGQSRTITLTFDIVGAPPRSKNLTRVTKGYAAFTVIGPGDPGQMRVEVIVPKEMTFDTSSDEFSAEQDGATTTHTATSAPANEWFWAQVSARDQNVVETTKVRVGDRDLTLEAYPGDAAWSAFVKKSMGEGLPLLERLVGTPWPGEVKRIREDSSVNLHGLGGYFDPKSDEIVIGEELDSALLYHELSHAWINSSRLDGRWLYEGLSEFLAQRAVTLAGGKPDPQPAVTPTSKHHRLLQDWEELGGGDSGDPDTFGYPASRLVITQMLKGAKDEQIAAIISSALEGTPAYDRTNGPLHQGFTGWEAFLDLVQSNGGNPGADALVAQWVTGNSSWRAGRTEKRTMYAALDKADGSWLPPLALRRAMTKWQFDLAEKFLDKLKAVAPQAKAVQDASSAGGLPVPGAVVALYEAADSDAQIAALATVLPEAKAAIDSVAGAVRADGAERNPFAELGARLQGVKGELATATTALNAAQLPLARTSGDSVTAKLDRASLVGGGVVGGGLAALAGLALALRAMLRRRRARAASVLALPGVGALQGAQHPGVAQGVGLDPFQVEEFGDPLVVGPEQLGVDLGGDGLPVDRFETVAREELGLEGEAEEPAHPEQTSPLQERTEQE